MLSISLLASTSFCTSCFSRGVSPSVAAGICTCLNFASCTAMFSLGGSCLTQVGCAESSTGAESRPRTMIIAEKLCMQEITKRAAQRQKLKLGEQWYSSIEIGEIFGSHCQFWQSHAAAG